jgi:hypothetical protein
MTKTKPQKLTESQETTSTTSTKKQILKETKKENAESALAKKQDLTNKEIIERLKLSKLDTIFLFTFTVTTIVLTYLSTLITTLGPLLPLLVISFSIYPYYIGIWHGMINENLCARVFAWNYLIAQFAILVAILIFTPIGLLLAQLASIQSNPTLSQAILVTIMLVGLGSAILITIMAAKLSRNIEKVFANALTISKQRISGEELRKANLKYSKPAVVLNPLTMTVEFFAIQEYLTTTGIFTQNIIPPNLAFIILTYVALAYFTYDSIKPTPKKTEKRTKKPKRKPQKKTAHRAPNIRSGKTHGPRHQKTSNK